MKCPACPTCHHHETFAQLATLAGFALWIAGSWITIGEREPGSIPDGRPGRRVVGGERDPPRRPRGPDPGAPRARLLDRAPPLAHLGERALPHGLRQPRLRPAARRAQRTEDRRARCRAGAARCQPLAPAGGAAGPGARGRVGPGNLSASQRGIARGPGGVRPGALARTLRRAGPAPGSAPADRASRSRPGSSSPGRRASRRRGTTPSCRSRSRSSRPSVLAA